MLSLGRAPEARGEARAGGRSSARVRWAGVARAPPRARLAAHLWGPAQGEHAGYEQGEHAGYEQGEHAGYEQGFSHIKWGRFVHRKSVPFRAVPRCPFRADPCRAAQNFRAGSRGPCHRSRAVPLPEHH